jgi:CheY-like chemotaxis protein
MKHVLVIDESELFREYLREKLSASGEIEITVAVNGLDAVAKMRSAAPDLIVIDYHLSRKTCREVLEEKRRNPNTAKAPVIITAAKIDRNRIMELIPFDVKKVFSKPVKVDALLSTIGSILGIDFDVDQTESVMEAHVNDNIIFIEVAKGLNTEKIEMLRFKVSELLDLYDIQDPRVLVLMTGVPLSFADASNLQRLLDNVLSYSKARPKYVRILTTSGFVREFIAGHKEYEGIEVCSSLQAALDGLLTESGGDGTAAMSAATERILAPAADKPGESFQMRFHAEAAKAFAVEDAKEAGKGMKVAVVDDDPVIQELVKGTFLSIAAEVAAFDDGEQFLEAIKGGIDFDLVLLDLVMPKVGGFSVLQSMEAWDIAVPVIVLSAVSQREAIVRAFQAGVKSYLIKPLKPASLVKKAAEVLRANF